MNKFGYGMILSNSEILFDTFEDHAGYPTFKGQVLNGEQLWDIVSGLEANELLFYTHLLTGMSKSVLCMLLILNCMPLLSPLMKFKSALCKRC